MTHHTSGRLAEAEVIYRALLAKDPAHSQTLQLLGTLMHQRGLQRLAILWIKRSLALSPTETVPWSNLGDALRTHNNVDEAIPALKRALILSPSTMGAYHNLGLAFLNIGDKEQAWFLLNRALSMQPDSAALHYTLATQIRLKSRQDPRLAALEELVARLPETATADMTHLHFALGSSYKDLGDADLSLQHFITANQFKRRMLGYNESGTLAYFHAIKRAFPAERLEGLAPVDNSNGGPILVIGMPRSGTSLVEQILASHSSVFGAGERTLLEQTLFEMFPRCDKQPEALASLPLAELRRAGDVYRAKLRDLAGPDPSRIVDKLPTNFFHCGLAAMMLPDARIVHMRRDPVDTCLSCFATYFAGGHAYATDLASLGRFYRAYQDLMAHWRHVLPPGVMIELTYEKVVADLEGELRPVFDLCGLAWQEQCLDFHRTRRTVVTFSQSQVRQPLFKSSTSSWRPSNALMKPLLDALGEEG